MTIHARIPAVALLVLAIGGGTALAKGPAQAQPACGSVITVDTKLAGDLTDCPGDGIVIGADGVTLDLNRHTIDGDAVPGAAGPEVGIRLDGHDGVTIKNGAVGEFDFGLLLRNASDLTLRSIVSSGNGRAGARLENVADSRFADSTLAGNGTFGLILFGGNRDNLIEHNEVSDNGGGIGDFVSEGDRIVHNDVSGNGDEGIVVGGSSGVLVERNTVSDNFAGVIVGGSDRNEVVGNRVVGNRDGIVLDGDGNDVVGNHVSDAIGCDDGEGCGFGISVEGGAGNLVAGNDVERTLHSGIRLDAYGAPVSGNVFRGNHVDSAGVDGIAIGTDDAGPVLDTLLDHNTVTGADDDGIDVDSPTTTLTHNHATHNGDLGIEAVPGVVDGGGNHAAGNGNPAECTNVAC